MNRVENIGGWTLLIAGGGLVVALLANEWRTWVGARGDPAQRPHARARLRRRALGGVLLLATVVLLRYPDLSNCGAGWQLARLVGVLALCLAALWVALWDFRIVRKDLRREVNGFVAESAQDLQKYLQDLAAKNPRVAEKLREVLPEQGGIAGSAGPGGTPSATDRGAGSRPPKARP